MSYEDKILLRIRRKYSKNESFKFILKKLSETQMELGIMKSYNEELKDFKKKVNEKNKQLEEKIKHLNNEKDKKDKRIRTLHSEITDCKREIERLRRKQLNELFENGNDLI